MTIVPYRTWNALGHNNNHLMNWMNLPSVDRERLRNWHPAMDIRETSDALVLSLDVPGMTKSDIELTLEDNVLEIKGRRDLRKEAKGDDGLFTRFERVSGEFKRKVQLSTHTQHEDVSAVVEDGVLTVTVKKPLEEQPKRIDIQ